MSTKDDFRKLNDVIGGFKDLFTLEESNNVTQKNNVPLPLSKTEIKAFEGLCAIEGKSIKEKMAELVENYIEEKRQKMK